MTRNAPIGPRRVPTPRGISRRSFLGGAAAVGAAGLALPSWLTGSAAATGRRPISRPAVRRRPGSGEGGSLFFENWPEYIDLTEGDQLGTVDRFIEATGIDMTYSEAFNDNNEYFALIQPVLGRGDTIEPDIIAPTSWLVGRLINLGWVDPLPLDEIPNAANLRDDLVKPAWDPTGEYSLPWQSGFAGIAYNLDVTGRELTSTEDLFDPEFKGKIGMLTEMSDTIGLILLAQGVDISTISSFEEAAGAFERLEQAKDDGQIRAFTGNDYINDLSAGNFAACIGWSGDVVALGVDNPNIRFVIPEEGGTSWADAMVMPKGAEHRSEAAKWMDFVYDPEQAARITAYVQYVSPVKGVREEVAKLDPELAESALLFPDEETLARVHTFANLSEDVEAEFDAAFSAIVGA